MKFLILLLLAGCGKKHLPAPTANPHAEGIDRQMNALKAMLSAPPGATACETAWNAFHAGDLAGKAPGATPLVLKLAPHDEFIQRCNALPAEAQPCLAPSSRKADECARVRPAPEVLRPMFELKPLEGVGAGERDADQQFMSTSKH